MENNIDKLIEDILDNSNDSDNCPFSDIIVRSNLISKPFGIIWKESKIIKLLEKRGYNIITKENKNGKQYKVAIKPGESIISDHSNIREVFDDEIQDIIIELISKV